MTFYLSFFEKKIWNTVIKTHKNDWSKLIHKSRDPLIWPAVGVKPAIIIYSQHLNCLTGRQSCSDPSKAFSLGNQSNDSF